MAHFRRIVVLLFAAGCFLTSAAGTSAATLSGSVAGSPFGCRASVTRVNLGGSGVLEPIVANPAGNPCATQSAGVSTAKVPGSGSPVVSTGPAGAFTDYSPEQVTPIGNIAPGSAAVASVRSVNIPTSSGTITVAGPVEADAFYQCVNDRAVSSGQSTLDVFYVGGKEYRLAKPGTPHTYQLPGGGYVAVNQAIRTATSLTERVLEVHLASGTDVIVGEARVTAIGADACAGTSGGPPSLGICPSGTRLDPSTDYCILVEKQAGGRTKIIDVSRPFKGPSGGRVYTLAATARRFPHSPCVRGRGPQWALIATKVGGRVLGTERSDRILAHGRRERVWAKEGNDCIDGTASRQHLWDGDGRDRIYAGPGVSHDGFGDGNTLFKGRHGHVWVQGGDGNDRVYGGRGKSRIDLGSGHDSVFGGPANDRIFVLGAHREKVSCGGGSHNVAFLRPRAVRYARAHGCQVIRILGAKHH